MRPTLQASMRRPVLLVAVATGVWACSGPARVAPARPATVPAAAIWASGTNEGLWFDCEPAEPARYRCTVFRDPSGDTIAAGQFVLHYLTTAREGMTVYSPVPQPPTPLPYRDFLGGGSIMLADSLVLLADGAMRFPQGPGYGKQAVYISGVQMGPQSTYGRPEP